MTAAEGATAPTTMVERAGIGTYQLPERIDPTRTDLADAFLAQPLGRHPIDVQLMISRLRSDLAAPRLVVQRSGKGWLLMEASRRRGQAPRAVATLATREAAEQLAFRIRWEMVTGTRLAGAGPDTLAPEEPRSLPLLGYVTPLSCRPGDDVSCHISAPGPVDVSVVRLRSRRPEEATTVAGLSADGCLTKLETVHPGSYGTVPLGAVRVQEGLSLQVTFTPAAPTADRQILAGWGDPWSGPGVALHVGPEGVGATARVGGRVVTAMADVEVVPWTWQTATMSVQPSDGTTPTRVVVDVREGARITARASTVGEAGAGLNPPVGDLVVGGAGPAGPVAGPGDVRWHFGGRVEQVALAADPSLTEGDVIRLATPGGPSPDVDLVGWWDFSAGIDGWGLQDRGPAGRHGTWHNLPRRAVAGSHWDGETLDWREAPRQFAAVHLLRDGLEDAGWPATHTIRVPDLPSGVYAFRITHAGGVHDLAWFVNPAPGSDTPVSLLIPTATYAAYSNSRFWWEEPIQEAVSDRLVEVGEADVTLMARQDLGLAHYDQHADGTDVTHVSERHPNPYLSAVNPHDEGFCSDLDLVEWLEARGEPYAVVTDADLDRTPELLSHTRVLLTGTHPEYVTATEFDAVGNWVRAGGRVLYLGGNGWQTRVRFDRERPWIMENRRIEHWGGTWPSKAAEEHLAADGEIGGYLRRGGRTARMLVGVETVTMGFDESRPFERVPDADPCTAWIFDNVEGTTIGDHGRYGGAVVGQEWDNSLGGDVASHHHVIARSRDHTIVPALFGASRSPYHCEMTVRFDSSGGAVFAVGTMAWCAALNDAAGDNDVARITANVLDRFLLPEGFF